MKGSVIAAILMAFFSCQALATSVTATDTTLDGAEKQIAIKTKKMGYSSYHITGAYYGNRVYMIATLEK